MKSLVLQSGLPEGLSQGEVEAQLYASLEDKPNLGRVLLIPPDITRYYSKAGLITRCYYEMLKDRCDVDVLPALGTHDGMTENECRDFFGGSIPYHRIIRHEWKRDLVKIGEIPGAFVREVSGGLMWEDIPVTVNKLLVSGRYDLVVSIGQVVPHEVVGMANYTKNILVGCGGAEMINASHMLGAFYGIERIMGKADTPVRRVLQYAEESFLADIPLMYVLTVTTQRQDDAVLHGIYIGRGEKLFLEAAQQSRKKNVTLLEKPLRKVVVFLEEKEFRSAWLGNKAIYRTRMALADGAELVILAPGVRKFGEDKKNDQLIRKYGYVGREKILELRNRSDLEENLSVAAHLIHGSPDSRFHITYAVRHMDRSEIESVAFRYADYDEMTKKYNPACLREGMNVLPDGEAVYYIANPALGLWAAKERF